MSATLRRPKPSLQHMARYVDRRSPLRDTAARLLQGERLLVTDRYGTGAQILAELEAMLVGDSPPKNYEARRALERTLRATAEGLLTPVVDHKLAFRDAQPIGFLEELYPELPRFFLPFVAVQELHGAWERYSQGVHLPVLGHRVHPFYGTYVPTRLTHLELFATWLSQHEGPRGRAVDVGCGSGVMSLMLCRAGFERVLATDNNPNAVESVAREIQRLRPRPALDARHGDLLSRVGDPVDLIVFNPPWMQGHAQSFVDHALYFQPGLLERFFEQAAQRLRPEGRVAVVFSNLIELVQPDVPHPIRAELDRGRFVLVNKLQRKVKASSGDGPRRRTREKVEVWELALAPSG